MSINADSTIILLVDNDIDFRDSVESVLKQNGFTVLTADGVEPACDMLKKHRLDLVISELKMIDGSGLDLLKQIRNQSPDIIVVIQTAYGSIESAVRAMRQGAYDYITKPFNKEVLLSSIEKALEYKNNQDELSIHKEQIAWKYGFDNIIGVSDAMRQLKNMAARVAATDLVILISGESGTGKELLARAIHYHSERRRKRFITVECSSIPESLLEAQLFGQVGGSPAPANENSAGQFDEGNGGTVFLDEVADLPQTVQAKILKVLQESEIRPIGSSVSKKIDVRIIAATNRDLADMVQKGSFREDLFYRLNVLPLNIPPLRQRIDDIVVLAEHFLKGENGELKNKFAITSNAMEKLLSHSWPGNVRELENTLKRAMTLSRTREIDDHDIVFITSSRIHQTIILRREPIGVESGTLEESLRHRIETMLHANDWNLTRTAAKLGIGRTTLWRKIKKYNIVRADEYANIDQE